MTSPPPGGCHIVPCFSGLTNKYLTLKEKFDGYKHLSKMPTLRVEHYKVGSKKAL